MNELERPTRNTPPAIPYLRGRNVSLSLTTFDVAGATVVVKLHPKRLKLRIGHRTRTLSAVCYLERIDGVADLNERGLAAATATFHVMDGSTREETVSAIDWSAKIVASSRGDAVLLFLRVSDHARVPT